MKSLQLLEDKYQGEQGFCGIPSSSPSPILLSAWAARVCDSSHVCTSTGDEHRH